MAALDAIEGYYMLNHDSKLIYGTSLWRTTLWTLAS